MEDSEPSIDEVARFELRLRRRARSRSTDGGDPSLNDLMRTIGDRRSARSRSAIAPPSGATTAQDPGHDIRGGARPAERSALRVLHIEQCGPSVRVIRIERPRGLDFRAGQHIKVGVPRAKRETFSIASAPHDQHLELAIELRPGGQVTPALFALGVGDAVEATTRAKGDLRIDPGLTHHLMVATVTGIAPVRSMVRDALHRGTAATFTVLHGASHAIELPFREELEMLAARHPNVTYVPTVSRPAEAQNRSWTGTTGRVDAVARDVASRLDPARTCVYAVGNGGMVATVQRELGDAGFGVSTESYG